LDDPDPLKTVAMDMDLDLDLAGSAIIWLCESGSGSVIGWPLGSGYEIINFESQLTDFSLKTFFIQIFLKNLMNK